MSEAHRSACKRALLALALGSLGAIVFTQSADAALLGASPMRLPIVNYSQPCTTPNATAPPPLAVPLCSTSSPGSSVSKLGPSGLGFLRLVNCPTGSAAPFCNPPGGVMPLPDVRATGNIQNVICTAGPNCPTPGTSPYNPNVSAGPYTSPGNGSTGPAPLCAPGCTASAGADLTAVFKFQLDTGSGGTTWPVDFPVPMVCTAGAGTPPSNCGFNTTFNAIVPGVVTNNGGKWQLAPGASPAAPGVIIYDSGLNGVREVSASGTGDDQPAYTIGICAGNAC